MGATLGKMLASGRGCDPPEKAGEGEQRQPEESIIVEAETSPQPGGSGNQKAATGYVAVPGLPGPQCFLCLAGLGFLLVC